MVQKWRLTGGSGLRVPACVTSCIVHFFSCSSCCCTLASYSTTHPLDNHRLRSVTNGGDNLHQNLPSITLASGSTGRRIRIEKELLRWDHQIFRNCEQLANWNIASRSSHLNHREAWFWPQGAGLWSGDSFIFANCTWGCGLLVSTYKSCFTCALFT